MDSALPIESILDLNRGNCAREIVRLPHDKGFVNITTSFEIGSTYLPHYHDKSHLSFILKGGIIDKRTRSETERLSGELMFFHAGEPHQSIYQIFPVTSISLELEPSFFTENTITEEILSLSAARNPNAKFIMLKIYKEILMKGDFSESSIELLLLGLIESKTPDKSIRPVWIVKVLELLNDSWNEPLSLKDLAKVADVHPITISKYFPKYVSCTLGEYRRRLKIERSLLSIKTSPLSLTEIAYQCGFSDQSHFTRTFKHLTGFLPNVYAKV